MLIVAVEEVAGGFIAPLVYEVGLANGGVRVSKADEGKKKTRTAAKTQEAPRSQVGLSPCLLDA